MKVPGIWVLLTAVALWTSGARARLVLIPSVEPQRVLAGGTRRISVVWHNADTRLVTAEVHLRLYQASSATAMPLSTGLWKKLPVLPGQTVLESTRVDFPPVKARTAFLIQWLDRANHVLGSQQVLVYPTNLLEQLEPLVGGNALGVFDPLNRLKPLLERFKVKFSDLGNSELEHFPGRLAILGPFDSWAQIPAGLQKRAEQLAKKGAAVIWIQPPPPCDDALAPSFYPVPKGRGLVVVVQAALVADLPENPRSQLNLIQICRLALYPEPRGPPDFASCSMNEPQPPSP